MMEFSCNAVGFEELVEQTLALQNYLNTLVDVDDWVRLLDVKSEL